MLLGASGDALTLTLGVTHSPVQVTHLDSELARLRGHCVTCAVRGMSRICRLLSFPRPPTDTGPRQLQAWIQSRQRAVLFPTAPCTRFTSYPVPIAAESIATHLRVPVDSHARWLSVVVDCHSSAAFAKQLTTMQRRLLVKNVWMMLRMLTRFGCNRRCCLSREDARRCHQPLHQKAKEARGCKGAAGGQG